MIAQEAYTNIPTELEAYAYSDDPAYLNTRERKIFEKYM